MSNIWPWSATRMLNLSATATLRICATPDSKHVKETHLDQTVLVSARGTNRNTIQPLGQLEASCQDTTKRSHNRRQSLHMECTLGQTRHTKSCWLRKGEPNEAFQLPAELAIWNDWVLRRSDTSLTLWAFWHKDTCLVLVWWGAELAKLCKMLRSVSKKDIKNRCCSLRAEGSCFKCVNPMWRSDCSSVPVSNQVPPFARQSLVAKWKWLRAPSQKAKRPQQAVRGKGLDLCLVVHPWSATRMPNLSAPTDTKNMCHCGFQACQRDKTGSNCKPQLRCSFLKTLLLVWTVDVELLFEIAAFPYMSNHHF